MANTQAPASTTRSHWAALVGRAKYRLQPGGVHKGQLQHGAQGDGGEGILGFSSRPSRLRTLQRVAAVEVERLNQRRTTAMVGSSRLEP